MSQIGHTFSFSSTDVNMTVIEIMNCVDVLTLRCFDMKMSKILMENFDRNSESSDRSKFFVKILKL